MFLHRRLIGFFLAFLLLVMQAHWLVHRLEHDLSSGAQEEAVCEFCLAMHGMGVAVSGPERTVSIIPLGEYRPGYASILRVDAESIQPRQQGPPNFS
ncbi:MAG: hypothetical protein FWH56_09900 [Betaproteobacteria bacterium]|nr:hypothetical protein [Betaproteobacteria bacterium]MCL2162176.1 hypothetical protein [Betaproteobacteria bacterium]